MEQLKSEQIRVQAEERRKTLGEETRQHQAVSDARPPGLGGPEQPGHTVTPEPPGPAVGPSRPLGDLGKTLTALESLSADCGEGAPSVRVLTSTVGAAG